MSLTTKDARLLAEAIVSAFTMAGALRTPLAKRHSVDDALRWGADVEITRGIPVPRTTKGPLYKKLPFARMRVGDSFFVPDDEAGVSDKGTARAIDVAFVSYLRAVHGTPLRSDVTYKIKTQKAEGGFRVWRVA